MNMALPACARRASSNIGIRAGSRKSKRRDNSRPFCFADRVFSASDGQHHLPIGLTKGMSSACFLERVFATGTASIFRVDLATLHKPARSGTTDIRATWAVQSDKGPGRNRLLRPTSGCPGAGGRGASRGFGSVGLKLAVARPMSGDVRDEQRPDRFVLTGLKALFSADHGAAAAGLGVADLGVAGFEHFCFGKLRFGFADQ